MAGNTSKKWWLIGCGGCLGTLVIITAAVLVLYNLGANSFKSASNGTVSDIFGKSYQPVEYIAIGLPFDKVFEQVEIKKMVMLLNRSSGGSIMALELPLGTFEARALKAGDLKKTDVYMQQLGNLFTQSSHQFQDVQFTGSHFAKLSNGKRVVISGTVFEMLRKGRLDYVPGAVALLPESNERLVVLLAFGGRRFISVDADADFRPGQLMSEEQLIEIINASELDDRLLK